MPGGNSTKYSTRFSEKKSLENFPTVGTISHKKKKVEHTYKSTLFSTMTEQLYVANLPFAMGQREIAQMLSERTSWPCRIVCFKRGPNVPYRRQSCFVHWHIGEAPSPSTLNNWLPDMLRVQYQWKEPLYCSYVNQISMTTSAGSLDEWQASTISSLKSSLISLHNLLMYDTLGKTDVTSTCL